MFDRIRKRFLFQEYVPSYLIVISPYKFKNESLEAINEHLSEQESGGQINRLNSKREDRCIIYNFNFI